jgi:hypothetical protein
MKKLVLTLFALMTMLSKSYGTHIFGSEISYKHIDSIKYEITVYAYRRCSDFVLNPTYRLFVRCYADTLYQTEELPRVSIQNLKINCSDSSSICTYQNSLGSSGFGIEKHTFIDTIDFASTKYAGFGSCSQLVKLEFAQCCRISDVNTGNGNGYANFAEINLELGNSSVDFTSDPLSYTCCSQPVYYNLGAIDTVERDKITYSWDCDGFVYSGNYSCTLPFQAYYPLGTNPSMPPIPTAKPPIGVYLNENSGDLIYTPTSCTEITPYGIAATEWRLDSTGTYVVVGRTRRNLIAFSSSCPANNTPTINGPYSYTICEEDQFCFDITTSDVLVVISSDTIADTLSLKWNEGIPGGSFTILNETSRLKTGRFCWTPPKGTASTLPYRFTATVDDEHCNFNSTSIRAFSITVKAGAKTTPSFDSLACGWYNLTSQIDSNTFTGNPGYKWSVLKMDSTAVTDKNTAYFRSNNSVVSTLNIDSLKIQRNGTYVIKHTITNSAGCSKDYFDTITVSNLTTTLIDFPKDTIVCVGTDFTINTTTYNSNGAVGYQWYANDSLLVNDTLPSLNVTDFQSDNSEVYQIQIVDSDGCTNSDAIVVYPNMPYQESLTPHYETCFGDTIHFSLDSALRSVSWSNGSSNIEQYITDSEFLRVTYTDTFGCVFRDSSDITIFELPQLNLNDSAYCEEPVSVSPGTFSQYLWSTGDSSSSILVSNQGTYYVSVVDSNLCENHDSVTISFHDEVAFELGPDTAFCGDSLNLNAGEFSTFLWNTGSLGSEITATTSGNYWVTVTDSNGCFATDTLNLVLLSNSNTPLLTRTGKILNSSLGGTHQWFNNSSQIANQSDSLLTNIGAGNYTAVSIDSNGCISDTSNTISYTANIKSTTKKTLRIYPNPTIGKLTIDTRNIGSVQSVGLYDSNGKLIESNQITNGHLIGLEWTPQSGILWIEVVTDNGVYRSSVMSMR